MPVNTGMLGDLICGIIPENASIWDACPKAYVSLVRCCSGQCTASGNAFRVCYLGVSQAGVTTGSRCTVVVRKKDSSRQTARWPNNVMIRHVPHCKRIDKAYPYLSTVHNKE